MTEKRNGSKIEIFINGEKVAEQVDVEFDGEIPDIIRQETQIDEYDYLFTIADLILENHIDKNVRYQIDGPTWTSIINAMIEFRKATDYE